MLRPTLFYQYQSRGAIDNPPPAGTWTVIQTIGTQGIARSGITVQTNDLILVFGCAINTLGTPSDNASGGTNTYTEIPGSTSSIAAPDFSGKAWHAKAKATETLTVTLSSGADPGVTVHVVRPSTGNFAVEDVNVLTETSANTAHTGASLDASTNSYMANFYGQESVAATGISNSPWTEGTEISSHVTYSQYYIAPSTASYTGDFTSSASAKYFNIAVAFQAVP